MLEFRRPVLLLMAAASLAAGQPALTTIQDVLYRADGTRFTGTMFIRYNSFLAGDTSNIATANLTLRIVNGVLNVKLVPTTTATAGAQYNITYNSAGAIQFTEVWAVPPSTLTLRVRDVRVSSGTVVGPPPVISPIQIGDVVGLPNALAVRPAEGAGLAIGRAAIINQAGQIDGAAGSLGDCVRVDGSSGACGGGGGVLPSFSDGETPAGTANGLNTTFTLNFAPSPGPSLILFRNGVLMEQGADYSLSGGVITFFLGSVPQAGDVLFASYRYANPANPFGTLTAAQVICSGTGVATNATTLTQLASCTIPAGLLGTGDRIEVQFQYGHTGAAGGFTGELHWGGTTVLSRVGVAAETAFVGRLSFGIYAGAQSWDAQSWGSTLALANSVGTAGENTTVALTISLRGQLSGVSADSVTLPNFTVVRYPAQLNP
jgi:hypothetical protein